MKFLYLALKKMLAYTAIKVKDKCLYINKSIN